MIHCLYINGKQDYIFNHVLCGIVVVAKLELVFSRIDLSGQSPSCNIVSRNNTRHFVRALFSNSSFQIIDGFLQRISLCGSRSIVMLNRKQENCYYLESISTNVHHNGERERSSDFSRDLTPLDTSTHHWFILDGWKLESSQIWIGKQSSFCLLLQLSDF